MVDLGYGFPHSRDMARLAHVGCRRMGRGFGSRVRHNAVVALHARARRLRVINFRHRPPQRCDVTRLTKICGGRMACRLGCRVGDDTVVALEARARCLRVIHFRHRCPHRGDVAGHA